MKNTKPSIAHILPGMYFGGVEVAILKSFEKLNIDFNYEIFYVRGRGELNSNQQHISRLIYRIIRNKNEYDLILTSLWWGHLIGILLSIFGKKWACFIHSTGSSSIIDKLVTKVALERCPNHLFDSESTKNFYKNFTNKKSFVIPYIFDEKNKDAILKKDVKYDFSWIGRNSKEKRLDLLAKFIRSLKERSFNFKCIISIAGKPNALIDKFAKESNSNIKVLYNTNPNDIVDINYESKMILCFSNYEGFSVTTAEAALRGNLVATRDVGEISKYLCAQNTIWLESLDENKWQDFIDNAIEILKNDDELYKKRIKSQEFTKTYFSNKNYLDSISGAFKLLITPTNDQNK